MGKAICIKFPSTEEEPDLIRLMLNGNVVVLKVLKF